MNHKYMLYILQNCRMYKLTKDLLSGMDDVEYIELNNNMSRWTEQQKAKVEAYDVFSSLKNLFPVLVVVHTERKIVGYHAIKEALENGEL